MFAMTEDFAQELLKQDDGNHSLLFPYFKKWIDSHNMDEYERFGIEEMMFFERDYLLYYLDIMKRKISRRKIVDIGCQHGFQQVIFPDFEYIGIDISKCRTMWDYGTYILGKDFTELDIDLSDSILISNMSLGYFNNWINKTDKEIAEKLSKCDYLYIATTDDLLEELKPYYTETTLIEDHFILGEHFRRVFFGREN